MLVCHVVIIHTIALVIACFPRGLYSLRHCLVHTFHTRTVPSAEAEIKLELSLEKARLVTALLWPSRVLVPTGRPPSTDDAWLSNNECETWACAAVTDTAVEVISTMYITPFDAPAHTRSSVGLQVNDSREWGSETRKHTRAWRTSYKTIVRSKEHVNARNVVSVSYIKQSLIGKVCALQVLHKKIKQ